MLPDEGRTPPMTPNLLDELEGVVRLMEAATQGEWYWNEHTANLVTDHPDDGQEFEIAAVYSEHDDDREPANSAAICAAVNFLRTHAPALADMAKRMEAAERDAAKWKGIESVMAMMTDKVEGQITSSCGLLLIDYAARNKAGNVELRFGGVSNVETGELGDWIVRIEKAAIDAAQEGEG